MIKCQDKYKRVAAYATTLCTRWRGGKETNTPQMENELKPPLMHYHYAILTLRCQDV